MERKLTITRKKYFAGRAVPYRLMIEDGNGIRALALKNGETVETVIAGDAVISVGADTSTGFAKSPDLTVEDDGRDAVCFIETSYSIYTGSEYRIRRPKG